MAREFLEAPSPAEPERIPLERQEEHKGVPEPLEKFVLISRDRGVFGNIIDTLSPEWENLPEADKKKLESYLDNLLRSVGGYKDRCEGLKKVAMLRLKDPEQTREAVQRSDERRRNAHNTLIDSLNILSRNMKEMGLDNHWRANDAIYSSSEDGMREKISSWALKLELGQDFERAA